MSKIAEGINLYQQAMSLRIAKQNQIASNIANADTPKYLAKEFNFNQTMQGIVQQKNQSSGVPLMTNPNHLSLNSTNNQPQIKTEYRIPFQQKPDGNTVEIEHERKEMIENSVQYQLLTQLTTGYFEKLRTAMSSERQ